MAEFKTGQWVICGGGYMQVMGKYYRRGYMTILCRRAGTQEIVGNAPKMLTPASLTPDFSNAKVGDECFSVEEGVCEIMQSKSDKLIAAMNEDGGWDAFTKEGKLEPESKHPLLFNSFAQFQAYWAEKALEMVGITND